MYNCIMYMYERNLEKVLKLPLLNTDNYMGIKNTI